jgi:hypothetical protein
VAARPADPCAQGDVRLAGKSDTPGKRQWPRIYGPLLHDLEGAPHKNCKNFSTEFLGKAERIGIFVLEEFHHDLPKFTVWSLAVDSVRRIFRPFGPFSPQLSPPSGPATGFSNGPQPKNNFLAISTVYEEIPHVPT